MTPTPELRFVERESLTQYGNDGACVSKTIHVLQQKWTTWKWSEGTGIELIEEWRDVPLVKEGT